jgi:hypothetical protein
MRIYTYPTGSYKHFVQAVSNGAAYSCSAHRTENTEAKVRDILDAMELVATNLGSTEEQAIAFAADIPAHLNASPNNREIVSQCTAMGDGAASLLTQLFQLGKTVDDCLTQLWVGLCLIQPTCVVVNVEDALYILPHAERSLAELEATMAISSIAADCVRFMSWEDVCELRSDLIIHVHEENIASLINEHYEKN